MSWHGYAVRPTGATIDPQNLEDSDLFDPSWVAYVLFKTSEQRSRPTRVLTSHGPLSFDEPTPTGVVTRVLRLGDEVSLYDATDGHQLGEYRVDGIVRSDLGVEVGRVPPLRIKHCVAK